MLQKKDLVGPAPTLELSNSNVQSNLPVISNFVSGTLTQGSNTEFGKVYDPATGKVTGKVYFSMTSDVDNAVAAAKAAFGSWSATPPIRRARILEQRPQPNERAQRCSRHADHSRAWQNLG